MYSYVLRQEIAVSYKPLIIAIFPAHKPIRRRSLPNSNLMHMPTDFVAAYIVCYYMSMLVVTSHLVQ